MDLGIFSLKASEKQHGCSDWNFKFENSSLEGIQTAVYPPVKDFVKSLEEKS